MAHSPLVAPKLVCAALVVSPLVCVGRGEEEIWKREEEGRAQQLV